MSSQALTVPRGLAVISTGATIERVRTETAVQVVVLGATQQGVVAGIAVHVVLIGITRHRVRPIPSVRVQGRQEVLRLGHRVVTTPDDVVTLLAVHQVRTQLTEHPVIIPTTTQRVRRSHERQVIQERHQIELETLVRHVLMPGVQGEPPHVRERVPVQRHLRITVDAVLAVLTVHRVQTLTAIQPVVPVTTGDEVITTVPVDGVTTLTTVDLVLVRPAISEIVPVTQVEVVVVRIAVGEVITRTAIGQVITRPARQLVITSTAPQDIITGVAPQDVGPAATVDHIITGTTIDTVHVRRAVHDIIAAQAVHRVHHTRQHRGQHADHVIRREPRHAPRTHHRAPRRQQRRTRRRRRHQRQTTQSQTRGTRHQTSPLHHRHRAHLANRLRCFPLRAAARCTHHNGGTTQKQTTS